MTGRATAEATPVARPLIKPLAPSCCAPAIGWAMSDTAPARTPFPIDLVAEDRPAPTSFGRRVENSELNTSLAFVWVCCCLFVGLYWSWSWKCRFWDVFENQIERRTL